MTYNVFGGTLNLAQADSLDFLSGLIIHYLELWVDTVMINFAING